MSTAVPPAISKVAVSAAGAGDNVLVAGLAGKRIRLYFASLVAAGAVTAQYRTGAAGTNLTGAASLITGTPWTFEYNSRGWLETDVAGQGLDLFLGGAVQVSGVLGYAYVS